MFRVTDPMADAFGARMRELFLTYSPQGWSNVYPLSSVSSYMDPYLYSYYCGIANSLGSPLDYTIVVLKTEYINYQVGPLCTTKWDQGYPFNASCNGCPYAGCATISMAQIMKFFGKPSTYNWAAMPDSTSNSTTANMIRLIGDRLGLNYNTCNVGAEPNDTKNAFQSFNYNVTQGNHDYTTEKNWLFGQQKPISMGGYTNSILGIPCGDGHRWVCDGVKDINHYTTFFLEFINPGTFVYSNQGYSSPSNPITSTTFNALYFSMNWGWAGDHDGWFLSSNVNSGNGNYQYGRINFYVTY
jgi:hypothetical protein